MLPFDLDFTHKPKILCIGDIMVDECVEGDVTRISPEAPVPVLRHTQSHKVLGGAGNVIRNLSSLGVETYCVVALDRGSVGVQACTFINNLDHVHAHFIYPASWITPLKTRFCAQSQHILRVDYEDDACVLSREDEDALVCHIQTLMPHMDCVILSDYAKGLLTPTLCQQIIQNARQHHKPVIVDPKGRDYTKYTGAHIITPNSHEIKSITHSPITTQDDYIHAAYAMCHQFQSNYTLVTLGARGMLCVSHDHTAFHIPSNARDVFDVSGAGDTVVAVLSMALALKCDMHQAVTWANRAGGIVVGKKGTATLTRLDLKMEEPSHHIHEKIMTLDQVVHQTRSWQAAGYTVGFTNGCFDVLHPGHISLLQQARAQCDYLIVALNDDDSIKRLKGPDRPIHTLHARQCMLAALAMVDSLVAFTEDTPLNLITHIMPNVLIKGADYTLDNVVGSDIVAQNGGRVFLATLEPGHSTTQIVHHIKKIA